MWQISIQVSKLRRRHTQQLKVRHLCPCMFMCVHDCARACLCTYIRVCLCKCVSAHVCVWICLCVCMHEKRVGSAYKSPSSGEDTPAAGSPVPVCTRMCVYLHTCVRECLTTCIRMVCAYVCVRVCHHAPASISSRWPNIVGLTTGLVKGPKMLNTVGKPSCFRMPDTFFIAGWNCIAINTNKKREYTIHIPYVCSKRRK